MILTTDHIKEKFREMIVNKFINDPFLKFKLDQRMEYVENYYPRIKHLTREQFDAICDAFRDKGNIPQISDFLKNESQNTNASVNKTDCRLCESKGLVHAIHRTCPELELSFICPFCSNHTDQYFDDRAKHMYQFKKLNASLIKDWYLDWYTLVNLEFTDDEITMLQNETEGDSVLKFLEQKNKDMTAIPLKYLSKQDNIKKVKNLISTLSKQMKTANDTITNEME